MQQLSVRQTNMFFTFFMLAYIVLSMTVGMLLPENFPMWANMLVSEVVILAPVLFLLIIKEMNPLKFLGLSRISIVDLVRAYVAAYCLLPCIYLINYVTMLFARNHVNGLVSDLYDYPVVIQIVLIALLPACVEEFIFRGIFYGSYRRKNMIIGALASGVFFGVAHMNVNQFAYAMVIGVAFCALYEASGNIFVPVTAHFAINANTILMMAVSNITPQELEEAENGLGVMESVPMISVLVLVIFLLGVGIIGLLLYIKVVKNIAQSHGRSGFVQESLKKLRMEIVEKGKGEEKVEKGERVLDLFSGMTVLFALVYMILAEVV